MKPKYMMIFNAIVFFAVIPLESVAVFIQIPAIVFFAFWASVHSKEKQIKKHE